jgi:hypothetical protein
MSALTFDVARSADGPRTFSVRSSVDNFASNLSGSISPANPGLSVQGSNIFFITNDNTTQQVGSRITLGGNNFAFNEQFIKVISSILSFKSVSSFSFFIKSFIFIHSKS